MSSYPALRTDLQDGDLQAVTHPSQHNAAGAAINDLDSRVAAAVAHNDEQDTRLSGHDSALTAHAARLLPEGGSSGQVPVRTGSGSEWHDLPAQQSGLPGGGSAGDVLTKASAADGDAQWTAPASVGGGSGGGSASWPEGGFDGNLLGKLGTGAQWLSAGAAVPTAVVEGTRLVAAPVGFPVDLKALAEGEVNTPVMGASYTTVSPVCVLPAAFGDLPAGSLCFAPTRATSGDPVMRVVRPGVAGIQSRPLPGATASSHRNAGVLVAGNGVIAGTASTQNSGPMVGVSVQSTSSSNTGADYLAGAIRPDGTNVPLTFSGTARKAKWCAHSVAVDRAGSRVWALIDPVDTDLTSAFSWKVIAYLPSGATSWTLNNFGLFSAAGLNEAATAAPAFRHYWIKAGGGRVWVKTEGGRVYTRPDNEDVAQPFVEVVSAGVTIPVNAQLVDVDDAGNLVFVQATAAPANSADGTGAPGARMWTISPTGLASSVVLPLPATLEAGGLWSNGNGTAEAVHSMCVLANGVVAIGGFARLSQVDVSITPGATGDRLRPRVWVCSTTGTPTAVLAVDGSTYDSAATSSLMAARPGVQYASNAGIGQSSSPIGGGGLAGVSSIHRVPSVAGHAALYAALHRDTADTSVYLNQLIAKDVTL